MYKTVQRLTLFPRYGAADQQVTLGNSRWTLRIHWRERLRAYFASIYNEDNEPVVEGRRVSPNTDIAAGVLDFPGKLNVIGDDSEQVNLGRTLHISYMEFE